MLNLFSLQWMKRILVMVENIYIGVFVWVKLDRDFISLVAIYTSIVGIFLR